MTISQPFVLAGCDGDTCRASVEIGLIRRFDKPDDHPHTIEKQLRNRHSWIIKNGKHFCSRECAEFAAAIRALARTGKEGEDA